MVVGGIKEGKEMVRILRSKNKTQEDPADFKTTYGEDVSDRVVFLPRSLNCLNHLFQMSFYKNNVRI
jgi:hypothetical protein